MLKCRLSKRQHAADTVPFCERNEGSVYKTDTGVPILAHQLERPRHVGAISTARDV